MKTPHIIGPDPAGFAAAGWPLTMLLLLRRRRYGLVPLPLLGAAFLLLAFSWSSARKVYGSDPIGHRITDGSSAELHQLEEESEEYEPTEEEENIISEIREFWKREPIVKRKIKSFPILRVPPRKGQLEYYPCMDCHDDDKLNIARQRELTEEHTEIVLDHGGNRFWCVTCHNLKDMNYLRGLNGAKIDFNKPYFLCGQCHAPRQADWFLGGHGKRIGNWKGEIVLLACTECHNPHSPSIKPLPPDPPPERHKPPPSEIDILLAELKKLFE